MNTPLVFGFLLELCIQFSFSKNLPSFVQVCKRNDPNLNECFINALKAIKPYLIKGIPEMDLPPGDPLHYSNITAKTGDRASATLEGELWNQIGHGLMDFEIKELYIDLDNLRCKSTLSFPNPRLHGEYKLRGKVLLFEIDAQGYFDLNSTDVFCDAEWYGKYYTKDGKDYIEVENIDLKVNAKTITTYFTNLFPGNQQLTETLNQAINENMDALKEELTPLAAITFSELTKEYYNRVFRLFSVDELFPRD